MAIRRVWGIILLKCAKKYLKKSEKYVIIKSIGQILLKETIMEFNIYTVVAFVLYALIILAIGIWSFKRSKNMSDYFLGGRKLGSWTTAISAQASDMSAGC